ncbi:outer membrane beta-barrel family protein [Winogradskyella maritima]|uniref:TonB-dependent receptor domain-containing protein n=1 Tax=Winogradskyella maritima TaxID=1517766 RepID=A0ABV8AFN8_9FLAO|nr:outer membrane beta-barrel family protein [Winogradskyella maritima]
MITFKHILCVFFCFCSWNALSQEYKISGKVVDQNNSPISFANVLILNSEDDSFVSGTSTSDDGEFVFEAIAEGQYKLKVTFIGFKTVEQDLNLVADANLETIILIEDSETLGEVSVIARKPKVTRKADRLTFNIANTALTEGSTLQVLRSTPGVIVTDGSINIKSSPAVIYINERRVQLTMPEVIQLLESAPANSIKSVDVITNPPASYDADSGAVINITMDKNLIAGYRGSIATSYTQGVYPRYDIGTSHFFKNDKIDLNINYNFNKQKINRDDVDQINYLNDNLTLDEIWTSDVDRTTRSETHNLSLNLDVDLSDKTVLSLNSTGLYTPKFNYSIFNNTVIKDANGDFNSRFTADNLSTDDKYNVGTDIGLRHEFKDASSLNISGHYTTYNYERNQGVISNFFDENNTFEGDSEFRTLAEQATEILNGKVDYSLPMSESASLETGLKYSNVTTQSSIERLDVINGQEQINQANSNAFDYGEKVFAGYINYTKSWDKWDLTLGLRAEQTNVEGFSETLSQTNTQDYLEWFPNLSLTHAVSDNTSLYVNYKRSITRPNYTDLNPFTFFLNENTVVEGNPNLNPTFMDHVILGSSAGNFTFEFYYINNDGAIAELPIQDNQTNIISYTPVNLNKVVDYGFDVSYYYGADRWTLYLLNSVFNITEEVDFGRGFTEQSQWSNLTILSNSFSFLKDRSLKTNLSLTYFQENQQGLSTISGRVWSDFSISKTIFDKKGILSLSFGDIFNKNDYTLRYNYLDQSGRRATDIDNRFVKLGFRYKFGNTGLNTNERGTDAEERERIKDLSN